MEYFRKIKYNITKPWLILGKGPTFKKYKNSLSEEYNIFGLNHVACLVKCDIVHFIDADVLTRAIFVNSDNILCPWHLHENNKVMWKTLPHLIKNEVLFGACQSKIYWYNCSTWKRGHYITPMTKREEVVKVRYFSAEAAFQILGMLGIKKVYSLGIDGGGAYAVAFIKLGLMPFRNQRETFDEQFEMIDKTLKQFNMTWEKL